MAVPGIAGIRGDLPGGDLQRGEQRGGAVAPVVMGAPLGQAGPQRQHRRGPVQRLDLALLIHADHDRFSGGVQVEARRRRGSSPRAPGSVENLNVSSRCGWMPHLRQIRATDANEIPSSAARNRADQCVIPSRARRPAVISQRRDHDLDLIDSCGRPRPRLILQRPDPARRIPVPPADHRRPRHPHRPGDLRVRHPVRGQQHHPRPLRQARRHARQPRQITQPLPVTLTQHQRRS